MADEFDYCPGELIRVRAHRPSFGFTHEDVALLHALSGLDLHERSCDTNSEPPFPCDCYAAERSAALKPIAAKIAALLTPK